MLKALTFTYEGANDWHDLGARMLVASGLRPDRAMANAVNLARALPPRLLPKAPFTVQYPGLLCGLDGERVEGLEKSLSEGEEHVKIYASAFLRRGYGVSSVCAEEPGTGPRTQRRLLGLDAMYTGPPSV